MAKEKDKKKASPGKSLTEQKTLASGDFSMNSPLAENLGSTDEACEFDDNPDVRCEEAMNAESGENSCIARIGRYQVLGVLARGGMGTVYRGIHPDLKRPVVLKKLSAAHDKRSLEQFEREAQILVDLQGSNIVRFFDYFVENGTPYIVEEFIDGMSVDRLLERQGALSPQVASYICICVARALSYAHSKNVIHRDVKPGNILISSQGEVKLTDFGISMDSSLSTSLSGYLDQTTGIKTGTLAYMSPEQMMNSALVDRRSDIFSLGLMFYEMLTGQKFYKFDSSTVSFDEIIRLHIESVKLLTRRIPRRLASIIKKMVNMVLSKRFQSMDLVLSRLSAYIARYDLHELELSLGQMMYTEKYKEPRYHKRRNIPFLCAAILIAFLGVQSLTSVLRYNNILERTILCRQYTKVMTSFINPAYEGGDLEFFRVTGYGMEEIKNAYRKITESPETLDNPYAVTRKLYTIPVYLRPGRYRVRLTAGSRVHWQTFTVRKDTLLLSFQGKLTADDLNVPVKFKFTITDARTAQDITDRCEFFFRWNNSWFNYLDIPEDEFKNGFHAINAPIRITSPGYKEEEMMLALDWYQNFVYIDFTLEPLN